MGGADLLAIKSASLLKQAISANAILIAGLLALVFYIKLRKDIPAGLDYIFAKRTKVFIQVVFLFVLAGFSILVGTSLLTQFSRNTLFYNGNWKSTKVELSEKKSLMGAIHFMISGIPLAKNHLNLGAWHGYQEVIFKKRLHPSWVKFDFWLDQETYLNFIFNKTREQFAGIRISAHPIYPNIYYQADPAGQFIQKQELHLPLLKPRSWNHFKIKFDQQETKVFINNEEVYAGAVKILADQSIGFRGSLNKVWIDNIVIQPIKGPPINESFTNYKDLPAGALFATISIILGNLIIFLIIAKLMRKQNPFSYLLVLNFFLLISITVLTGYKTVTAELYPNYIEIEQMGQVDVHGLKLKLQTKVNFETEADVIAKINQRYLQAKSTGTYRILFIGSSQTWGEGVSAESNSFVNIVGQKLNFQNPSQRYECINASIAGYKSDKLFGIYRQYWLPLRPDLVIINLSYNDAVDPRGFRKNLEDFVQINQKQGIRTIFMAEAYSVEYRPRYFLMFRSHRTMKAVASENQIKFIDMHAHILQHYDDGLIWWDYIHLSDFGHRLVASELLRSIKTFLP